MQDLDVARFTLGEYATKLRCHPRTILRWMAPNGYESDVRWVKDYNPIYRVIDIATALGTKPFVLNHIMHDKDKVLTAKEAAAMYGLTLRAFQNRHYEADINRHRFKRFARRQLIKQVVARSGR